MGDISRGAAGGAAVGGIAVPIAVAGTAATGAVVAGIGENIAYHNQGQITQGMNPGDAAQVKDFLANNHSVFGPLDHMASATVHGIGHDPAIGGGLAAIAGFLAAAGAAAGAGIKAMFTNRNSQGRG